MPWLSVKEAAAHSGLCVSTIMKHIKENPEHPLPARMVGHKWLIEDAALDEWIKTYPQPSHMDMDKIVDDILGKYRNR